MGIRSLLGIKYYKITGQTDHKLPYNQHAAREKAAEHAGNFLFNREKQVEWLSGAMDGRPALIVAPYDAELFGHWWFEGPQWIDFLLRKMHYDQQTIKTITDSGVSGSSFDQSGVAADDVELGIQRLQRSVAGRQQRLDLSPPARRGGSHGRDGPSQSGAWTAQRRALNQAARELLLAQSSDWAFILKTGTMVDYAIKRTRTHVHNFNHLYELIKHDTVDEGWLADIESKHNLFPSIDYRVYA